MWSLLQNEGIRGTYGMDFPVADDGDYAVLWREVKKVEAAGQAEKRSGDAQSEDHEARREAFFVYYSRDEFEKLAANCGPTMNYRVMKQSREHAMALARVVGWLPLALSSLPIADEQIEWSESRDAHLIPALLKKTKTIRKERCAHARGGHEVYPIKKGAD
jgi:hypothetical protein